ncbi:MAG: hypothetical protein II951_02270 [Bacteroidales bacterium]|nr:hypothetical protein [Bacteroidales bacterium]
MKEATEDFDTMCQSAVQELLSVKPMFGTEGVSRQLIERIINVALFFSYTEPIRRVTYTTNIVEGYHRHLLKAAKSKSVYPSDRLCSGICIWFSGV